MTQPSKCIFCKCLLRSRENNSIVREGFRNDIPINSDTIQKEIKPSESSAGSENHAVQPNTTEKRSVELQQIVTNFHFGSVENKYEAASQFSRIIRKDMKMNEKLADLNVIPALVGMLESPLRDHQSAALQALILLCSGNYKNKGLFMEAGVTQMLGNLFWRCFSVNIQEKIGIALLSISSHNKNRAQMGSSAALSPLVCLLESGTKNARRASLAALYNLSGHLGNVNAIVRTGAVQPLVNMVQSPETADRSLGALINLLVTKEGREEVEYAVRKMPKCLIDILGSESSSYKGKERASYILMVLACRRLDLRQAMIEAGIVPVLLEISLLGTTLAQKRAKRILKYLTRDWRNATAGVKNPVNDRILNRISDAASPDNQIIDRMSLDKREDVYRRSLDTNMDRIMKRANLPCNGEGSFRRDMSLVNCSSAKSLQS